MDQDDEEKEEELGEEAARFLIARDKCAERRNAPACRSGAVAGHGVLTPRASRRRRSTKEALGYLDFRFTVQVPRPTQCLRIAPNTSLLQYWPALLQAGGCPRAGARERARLAGRARLTRRADIGRAISWRAAA